MKYKIVLATIVLLLLSFASAYAGNQLRIGTAGATELLIPVGSRGSAMGGAVMSSVSGVEAIYWNPAGLASLEGTEAMFTHQPYIADIDVNFAGVATEIYGFGVIGVSAKIISIGDMEETTVEQPYGTGRIYSPSLTVLGLTYSRILTANVSFGLTTQFIHEALFDVSASGVAFDVGFMYDPRWRGLSLGLSIKNYGATMAFSGPGFNRELDDRTGSASSMPFELPSSFNLGFSYDFLEDGPNFASFSGNFRSNNFYDDFYQAGAEYVYDGKYSLRGGYVFSEEDNYIYGASVGAGVLFSLGSTDLSLEYSWQETDVFDDNQYFTLKAKF